MFSGLLLMPKIVVILHSVVAVIGFCIFVLRRTAIKRAAIIKEVNYAENLILVKVKTHKPVAIFPGCYFFLRLSEPRFRFASTLFDSDPRQPFWYGQGEQLSPRNVQNLTFLLPSHKKHAKKLRYLEEDQRIDLSGPYGTDLQLHHYEDVLLVAKGNNLNGVLSYALSLCSRRNHDDNIRSSIQELQSEETNLLAEIEKLQHQQYKAESPKRASKINNLSQKLSITQDQIKDRRALALFNDKVRKVDLLWVIEETKQASWAAEAFQALRKLDSKNVGSLSSALASNHVETLSETDSSVVYVSRRTLPPYV